MKKISLSKQWPSLATVKQKNFDIIKCKDTYHINAIEKYKGYSLKVAGKIWMTWSMVNSTITRLSVWKYMRERTLIGTIIEILQPGANDVWVVKRKGKRDLLLPYIPPVVLNVDIPNKRVDVEILEGLDDEDWYFNPLSRDVFSTGALNRWKGSRKKGLFGYPVS